LGVSRLPRSTPEAQGLITAALDSFVAALDAAEPEIQTVMLLRHGQVVLEEAWAPYRLDDRHLLFSVSKSFTSTGVGLAIDAGLLSLDDQVISFFDADELPETVSDNLAAMKVRHLLTMTTGHSKDTVDALSRDRRMVKIFLGLDVEHEPGTVFVYNSGATYMLSAILQRLTGERLLDYLRPRLFEPLGATEATWQVSREGITVGGWGLSINTESLAAFGQLLLQHGEWQGKQLVPAEWFEAATSKQVPNDTEENPDWKQGYGFQFWRGRHNTYRGDGAFGQFCLVFPDYDGNGMFRTLGNIRATSRVALLFLELSGEKRKLRMNGHAEVSTDAVVFGKFPGAQAAVVVAVADIFPNCPRYLPTMQQVARSEFVEALGEHALEPFWKGKPDLKDFVHARRVF